MVATTRGVTSGAAPGWARRDRTLIALEKDWARNSTHPRQTKWKVRTRLTQIWVAVRSGAARATPTADPDPDPDPDADADADADADPDPDADADPDRDADASRAFRRSSPVTWAMP